MGGADACTGAAAGGGCTEIHLGGCNPSRSGLSVDSISTLQLNAPYCPQSDKQYITSKANQIWNFVAAIGCMTALLTCMGIMFRRIIRYRNKYW